VFRVHYRWLATKPALARILLQELTFYSSGKQAATFLGIRKRLIDGIEALVRAAQRGGWLARGPADRPAHLLRHSASTRWWDSPHGNGEGESRIAAPAETAVRRLTTLSGSAPAKSG
jgi:integrase